MLQRQLPPLLSVRCGIYLITACETIPQEGPQVVVVFDHQHRETVVAFEIFCFVLGFGEIRICLYIVTHQKFYTVIVLEMTLSFGERDLKRTSPTLFALHLNGSMMQVDQLFHQRKAYTCRLLVDVVLQNGIKTAEE